MSGTDLESSKSLSSVVRASILDSSFEPLKVRSVGMDRIEYISWLKVYTEMQQKLKLSSPYLLGINYEHYTWDRWVSYLFVHVGWYHLLSNLLFLFFSEP